MLAKNMSNLLPTLGLVLVLIIASMLVVNFFGVNMSDNGGLRVLNRAAVFEGMCSKKHQESMKNKEGLLVEDKEAFLEGSMTMEESA